MSGHSAPVDDGSHPLAASAFLTAEGRKALAAHWIQTAEQVLALAATPEGRTGLRNLLSTDDAMLDRILADLAGQVGVERAAALSKPAPPGGRLGAVLTDEQRTRFGRDNRNTHNNDGNDNDRPSSS